MKRLLLTALIIATISASAQQTRLIPAEEAWESVIPLLEKYGKNLPVSTRHHINTNESCPIYVYELVPAGYVVMTGSPELPNVLSAKQSKHEWTSNSGKKKSPAGAGLF